MKKMHLFSVSIDSHSGQSLVELVITIGLLAILLPAIIVGIIASRSGKAQAEQRTIAVNILRETEESLRIIRNNGWASFAVNGTYHIIPSGNTWILASGSTTTNGFTQQIVISDIYRSNNVIVPSPTGTLDLSTKRIDTTISWGLPYASSLSSTTYLTRWLENASFTDTLVTDFNRTGSVKSAVTVQATSGSSLPGDGEVLLGSGGYGNWCSPDIETTSFNLPGNASQSIITAIQGHAFIGTGGNASGDSLDHLTISNPAQPAAPVPSLAGSYDNYKSYGIFGEAGYAYLTSDHPGLTFEIVQISSTPYTQVGTGNASSDGMSIYVTNNLAYVTTSNSRLYIFDITTKTGSHSPVANVTLAGRGQKVVVVGSNAYIAINNGSTQMQIVPLGANGKTPGTPVNISVNGNAGVDVSMSSDGKRAYLATTTSTTKREFFIIDTDPLSGSYKQTKGSYDTSGMDPRGVAVVSGNKALLGGTGGENYQIIDINNENSPTRCGGIDTPYDIRAFAPVIEADGDVYAYVLAATDPEFRIVGGGPGGSYATTGTYESAPFNPGYSTANNRFTATFDTPSGTSIQFQVSMASLQSGSCPTSGYTYLDFNGNVNQWQTIVSGQPYTFPFVSTGTYTNPGQCIRYKASMTTTNGNNTPVLKDVIVNYSP